MLRSPLLVSLNLPVTLQTVVLLKLPQFHSFSMPSVARTLMNAAVFILVIIFVHHLHNIVLCMYKETDNNKKDL